MALYDKIRTLLCADHFLSRYFSKAKQTAAGQPLHRIFRASLHSCGGAFYSVTCSQRKYHYFRLRILARSCAKAALQRGIFRSSLLLLPWACPGAPAVRLNAGRTYLSALFIFPRIVDPRKHISPDVLWPIDGLAFSHCFAVFLPVHWFHRPSRPFALPVQRHHTSRSGHHW